jgi:hypothetical protein
VSRFTVPAAGSTDRESGWTICPRFLGRLSRESHRNRWGVGKEQCENILKILATMRLIEVKKDGRGKECVDG